MIMEKLFSRNDIIQRMTQKSAKLLNVPGAAEGDGLVGTGTEPKTLAPLEFVVFKIDELVLQF